MKGRVLISCFFILLFASCGSKKTVVSKSKKDPGKVILESKPVKLPSADINKHIKNLQKSNSNLDKNVLKYIEKYASISVYEMHQSKIPASITLSQGILESGSGRSKLASKSNNHFGIKCHKGWLGERVYHDDDSIGECFRKYQYVETSYKDHSAFLSKRKRYSFLFDYKRKDYKKWARGLKKAGYATDRKYPNKLISIIERYKLYEFDKVKKGNFKYVERKEKSKKIKNNTSTSYKVKKGDTLYAIARKFNISVATLKRINGLKSNEISIDQVLKTN
jgi:flagellum-specific peptidoglycan hydrolase FlgJ